MDSAHITFDDSVDGSQDNPTLAHNKKMDAVEALKCIDHRWYKKVAGKKARWMDLIGDYAGNERFILDGNKTFLFCFRGSNDCMSPGESLLQHVLDDPLLALARTDGEPVCHARSDICFSLRNL
jgi:hypothetical protein